MQNKKPRSKPNWLQWLSLLILSFIYLILIMNQDNFIIQYGIQTYRTIRQIVCLLNGLVVGSILMTIGTKILKQKKQKQLENQQTEKHAQEKDPILSVQKNLDSAKLYNLLISYARQPIWAEVNDLLINCAGQLHVMDTYQDKLKHLLDNNGAYNFSDTQDVLDQVEQYICKNIRKIINYMDIADGKNEKDMHIISTKLQTCYTDSANQLDQVKEFLFVMADFLNKQGENDTTPDILDMYKSSILKSIEEENA